MSESLRVLIALIKNSETVARRRGDRNVDIPPLSYDEVATILAALKDRYDPDIKEAP